MSRSNGIERSTPRFDLAVGTLQTHCGPDAPWKTAPTLFLPVGAEEAFSDDIPASKGTINALLEEVCPDGVVLTSSRSHATEVLGRRVTMEMSEAWSSFASVKAPDFVFTSAIPLHFQTQPSYPEYIYSLSPYSFCLDGTWPRSILDAPLTARPSRVVP